MVGGATYNQNASKPWDPILPCEIYDRSQGTYGTFETVASLSRSAWNAGNVDWMTGWERAGGDFDDDVYGRASSDVVLDITYQKVDRRPPDWWSPIIPEQPEDD